MKRNKFSLSHYSLLTAQYGNLIPLTWYEALPGDTIQSSVAMLIRATPLVAPPMHPVRVRVHTFFVPNRLIWDDWENFITGGDDGTYTEVPPEVLINDVVAPGDFEEYMGIPPGDYTVNPLSASALPFRAYNLIYNEMYRDQDLVPELAMATAPGVDTTTILQMQRVAWEKDYFTSARPWAAKGNEILIPIGDRADVMGIGWGNNPPASGSQSTRQSDGSQTSLDVIDSQAYKFQMANSATDDGYPDVYADLTSATGISVNDLRNFLAQQRYQEARAQFGSRYSEYLKYLVPGIGNLDSRLQEPEYVAGGSSTISFSEVLQTQSSDTAQTPLATMAGHGISAMRTRRARKFTPEHGIMMTLLSVVPKAIYSQEVDRKWHRKTKEEYFQKELQFIGEQPILNREVYNTHSTPLGVFGYNHRYDEYRGIRSRIHGEFHDTADGWHYARIFSGDVALNKSFIECNPSVRPHADQVGDPLYIMAQHSIQARRILSKWATPKTF